MRKGFTLVELSIVLVIIGLLIGGVLKGKAMIDGTKVKRVKTDVDGILAAVYSYQDKFGALPGDDVENRTADFGVNCTGNGDGLFSNAAESVCAWRYLIGSEFVAGDASQTTEQTVSKRSPFGGMYMFRTGTHGNKNGNYVYIDNMPSNVIKEIDEKYDDGVYNTGTVQANNDYPATPINRDMYWYAF